MTTSPAAAADSTHRVGRVTYRARVDHNILNNTVKATYYRYTDLEGGGQQVEEIYRNHFDVTNNIETIIDQVRREVRQIGKAGGVISTTNITYYPETSETRG